MKSWLRQACASVVLALATSAAIAAPATGAPVRIGLDAEYSIEGSTSAQAIELGIRVALHEINAAGGVLGGRPLELVTRDNHANPARGIANLSELAAMPDLVAVFGGRFSPVLTEVIKPAHELKIPLLAPWSSATSIINNGQRPNYAFRLALHDQIAMPAMIDRVRATGRQRIGLILANTTWGRSNREAAERHLARVGGAGIVGIEFYNSGDEALLGQYTRLLEQGAQAVLLVINDRECAILLRAIAGLDAKLRVPLVSHWGITGGRIHEEVGAANFAKLDFSVIQTFSLLRADPRKVRRVIDIARRIGGVARAEEVQSPVGFGHAYDLTHILARAIDLAGSTDRARIRSALEQVRDYDGLLRRFDRPFTPERHEALVASDVFFARYRADGALVPIERGASGR